MFQEWAMIFQTETVPSTFWDRLSWDVSGRKLAVANRSCEVSIFVNFNDFPGHRLRCGLCFR